MVEDSTLMKLTAILSVTAIEIVNICTANVDGAVMGIVIAAVCGLAGYEIGKRV